MEALLLELDALKKKIEAFQEKPKELYNTKFFNTPQKDKELYYKHVNHDRKHFLITLTFDPKVANNLDEFGQRKKLQNALSEISNHKYWACFEKHKSGILHAHIMIQSDDYHLMQEIAYKMRKHITKSQMLAPAIKIQPVKHTMVDHERTYNYIWDDKPDHPIYKYIQLCI